MNNILRLAIVDPDDVTRDKVKNMLLGMESIWLEAECSRYDFFADVVKQTNPDVGLVVMDGDLHKSLQLVTKVSLASPECELLVVSSSTDGGVILQAMRAGAKEFLSAPVKIEDLVASIGRIADRRFGGGKTKSRQSEVYTFVGASGGVGSTTIGVNVGTVLAQNESKNVALIDFDLPLGDADVLLDSIPEYTLLDVAENVTRLDITLLKRSMTRHGSGLFLLPRPPQLEDINRVVEEDMRRVIGLMKASFSHVLIDLSKSFSPIDIAAMEMSTKVIVVIQLDLACLRNTVRLLSSLDSNEAIRDKIVIVVNRSGTQGSQISTKKIREALGREVYWEIPNNHKVAAESRDQGIPFTQNVPKSNLSISMVGLAEKLIGLDVESGAASRGGKNWFKNLLSSGKES
jgi:pilus assembly protein CpaE